MYFLPARLNGERQQVWGERPSNHRGRRGPLGDRAQVFRWAMEADSNGGCLPPGGRLCLLDSSAISTRRVPDGVSAGEEISYARAVFQDSQSYLRLRVMRDRRNHSDCRAAGLAVALSIDYSFADLAGEEGIGGAGIGVWRRLPQLPREDMVLNEA